jgi:tetratricopeptide (TPR) repeat protein
MWNDETTLEALRDAAYTQHESGELDQAESAYLEVLRRSPDDLDVQYALAVLTLQTGRYEVAAERLTRLLEVRESADAYDYLGNSLFGLSRPEDALESHERAIALSPDHAPAHINRGHVLRALQRPRAALESFDRAIQAQPRLWDAYIGRADILRESSRAQEAMATYDGAIALGTEHPAIYLGRSALLLESERWSEALESVDEAIRLGAATAEAHVIRGLAQGGLNQPTRALASFDQALALRANYAPAHINRGAILRQLKRPREALACQEAALAVAPDSFEALVNSAAALSDLERFEEALSACNRALAIAPHRASDLQLHFAAAFAGLERFDDMLIHCDRAVALRPNDAESRLRRAIALLKLRCCGEALAEADSSIALAPESPDAHVVRGAVLRELKRIEESVRSFETALSLRPDDPLTRFAVGCLHLLSGNFRQGFSLYSENGWANRPGGKPPLREYSSTPLLGGEEIEGRTLYLYADQGLGDTIMFARYALVAAARGAQVILSVPASLCRLMGSLAPRIQIVRESDAPPNFDYHCSLAHLPVIFETALSTLPATVPYLSAEPAKAAGWREKIGTHGFKIGICWQGSAQKLGGGRSFPLDCLRAVSRIPGVRLISLQKFEGSEQMGNAAAGMRVEHLGDELDGGHDAFIDTAAVIENLDLVITCDTSIAHLAGALACPTWVVLKYVPDWRWLLDRTDSPWYPTLRLFRQSTDGDWSGVFAEIYAALAARCQGDEAQRDQGDGENSTAKLAGISPR